MKRIRDTLAKVCDDGGALRGVTYALLEGNPRFITAVGLRFEALSATFRAVAEDDTVTPTLGPLEAEPGESLVEATRSAPWSGCVSLGLCWGGG